MIRLALAALLLLGTAACTEREQGSRGFYMGGSAGPSTR